MASEDERTGLEKSEQPTWALIVVHGVGETEPGTTIDALLPALKSRNAKMTLSGDHEIRLLEAPLERDGDKDFIKSFPVHVRQVNDPHGEAGVVAEVYWADLSQVRDGMFHVLWGVFVTIFGLHDIVDQAAAQPGKMARILRIVLYLAGWLLRGPIAAFNLFNLMLLAIHGLPPALSPAPIWIALSLGLLGILVGGLMWWNFKRRSPAWRTFLGAVVFVGAWMAGTNLAINAAPAFWPSVALNHWIERSDLFQPLMMAISEQDTAATISKAQVSMILLNLEPIGFLWLVESFLVVLGAFVWAAACAEAWQTRRGRFVPALTLAYVTAILQLALWVLIFPMLVLVAMRSTLTQHEIDVFKKVWNLLGIQYLLALTLVVVVGLTWCVRWLLTRPFLAEDSWRGRPLPRLLVGFWIQACLIGIGLPGCAFYLFFYFYNPETAWVPSFPGQDIARVLAPVFVFLAAVIPASGFRSGLHIIADVINHFHRVPGLLRPPQNAETKSEYDFVIRKRIEARFRIVLAEILKSPKVTRLFILAHSQGTVAAACALRQKGTAKMLEHLHEVRFVTMGSPLTHLYQHYFPDQYPPFDAEYWSRLKTRIPHWLNLFRIDDFVGTNVIGPDESWPRNEDVSTGGHINYWRQPAVLDKLSEFFFSVRSPVFRCPKTFR